MDQLCVGVCMGIHKTLTCFMIVLTHKDMAELEGK